jgi:hypothetical protein
MHLRQLGDHCKHLQILSPECSQQLLLHHLFETTPGILKQGRAVIYEKERIVTINVRSDKKLARDVPASTSRKSQSIRSRLFLLESLLLMVRAHFQEQSVCKRSIPDRKIIDALETLYTGELDSLSNVSIRQSDDRSVQIDGSNSTRSTDCMQLPLSTIFNSSPFPSWSSSIKQGDFPSLYPESLAISGTFTKSM